MANLNAADVAELWAKQMAANVGKMKAGVMAVTESPMEKAAAAADRYADGVRRAVEEGRYQEGLRSVSLGDWQRLTAEKGSQRIAQGVKEAMPKMQAFLAQLLPYAAQVSKEVQGMAKGSLQDSAARMLKNMELMSQFRFRKRK